MGGSLKFDKNYKVIPATLKPIERLAFIVFLAAEIARHEHEIANCHFYISTMGRTPFQGAMKRFYRSAIARHKKDVEETTQLLEGIIEKE